MIAIMARGAVHAPKWVNPFKIDKKRDGEGEIEKAHMGRVWVKRVIALGLLGGTVAAVLLFLKIIPNDLSQTQRAIILGVVGGVTAGYISPLVFRNIQARSIPNLPYDEGDHSDYFIGRCLQRVNFKYDEDCDTYWLPRPFPTYRRID